LLFVAALAAAGASLHPITVDYPAQGTIFPPDMAAPTFQWRDASKVASLWLIEASFRDGKDGLRVRAAGEPPHIGEIDERCMQAGAVMPELSPEQAVAHTWKPDPSIWSEILRRSVKHPATIRISGFLDDQATKLVSRGTVSIRTATDPVGAPIFYRDVPLISVPVGKKGVIMPLPTEAVPYIAWRLRYVNEPTSKVMMEGLPTCANCHSFSSDGKTLGIDVDGPQNDKGLYGLIPIEKVTKIENKNVIRWSSFAEERADKRFGFMSQISPDGRYVITSIKPKAQKGGLEKRLFNGFYSYYGFGQVFYPTRGILAWYSRDTGKLCPLPGADDPRYVQTSAFWSPDGKYLVYSRAPAKEPYYEGQVMPKVANDPNETQIQYDLYRIPFNNGQGGKAEPVRGASQNGMSNNFPKVSPDNRWIIYVENKNGLLMRPDSKLYIVPFKGGRSRPLKANLPSMNSWHTFSPNGRWLAFSSKGRSPYTQLFLTHIDAKGNDSPPILVENATAANRAVNIPEFLNIGPGELEKIEAPATDFYGLCNVAADLTQRELYTAAITAWENALRLEPDDSRAHYNLAFALQKRGEYETAINEYRTSIELNPDNTMAYGNLGVLLVQLGRHEEAIAEFEQSLAVKPDDAAAHNNLGAALLEKGDLPGAVEHCRRAIEILPKYADAHNCLGIALARSQKIDAAIPHLEKAAAINPESPEFLLNLGRMLASRDRFEEALPAVESAVKLLGEREPDSLDMLAAIYAKLGRYSDAVDSATKALRGAMLTGNRSLAQAIQTRLANYQQQESK